MHTIFLAFIVAMSVGVGSQRADASLTRVEVVAEPPTLADAQRLFYNGRYNEAAELTLSLRSADTDELAGYELRTSALLFQLKHALRGAGNPEQALKRCAFCADLMAAFLRDTASGQTLARARLQDSKDETALFFLGKIDLNYVWLQLGVLGRRTGWNEYWEARRSLDGVLKLNPQHVRARVARAWIDYIVDTKMPWGTGWLLGGGNKKRAIIAVREAAAADADFFTQAEAKFALWDMQVRERNFSGAVATARRLASDFPDNQELTTFLQAR